MADAEGVCRQILSVDPGHAQTLHLLGLIEHQRGRSDDAIKHIRTAITRYGQDPAFYHNLGNILRALDRPGEAMACYEGALALASDAVDSLYNLGNTCQDLGQPDRAIAYFERALRLRPDAIELHHNLGSALQDLGQLDEAIACYRKALAIRPDAVEILDNLGGALREQGQLDAAQASYESALALRPDRVESHTGLGVVLRDRGHLEEAVASHERALALMPNHAETLNNLGLALDDLGRREEAVARYKGSLALQPDRAETHYNLAIALEHQCRYAEALACYGRALALKPDYARAHFNRSLTLLLTGQFKEGWEEYEWRFVVAQYDRGFDRPLWSGELLAGRTILLHAEQGFGDTLQFLRYVPIVAERGGRVVLEVPASLVRLARTVAGATEVVAAGDPLPAFDCHCPLLSLPRVFKTNLATIPGAVPVSEGPDGGVAWLGRADPHHTRAQSGDRMGRHYGRRDRSAVARTIVGSRGRKLVQSSGRRPVGRHLVSWRSKDRRPVAMAHGFCRNRGCGFSPGSGHQRGHFGRTSGGRTRPADVAPVALSAGMAMAARARRQPLVSDRAAVSSEEGGGLAFCGARGRRRPCTTSPLKHPMARL